MRKRLLPILVPLSPWWLAALEIATGKPMSEDDADIWREAIRLRYPLHECEALRSRDPGRP